MKSFYITTPIYYVNDIPHIGHAYTSISADVIARYKRLLGYDVFFLTGTDEHGAKIEAAAKLKNKEPQEFVDEISLRFRELSKTLNLSNSDFIRTTNERHVNFIKEIFNILYKKGYVYESTYEGLYCTGCENYLTEKELVDGKCPIHKKEVTKIKENGYFFKLSVFKEKLMKLYENDSKIILPKGKNLEMLNRLKNEELRDLYISRRNVKWGIPLPWNESCTLWVWVEALFNYVSVFENIDSETYKKYWPADIHLIGKDILWFHTVVWHSLLLALEIPLPKTAFSHGWWTINGEKMSKSLGNVIYPKDMVSKYGVDSFRYTLMKEISFGQDGNFSEERLISNLNTDLADNLGNIVNRTLVMTKKYFDGIIPSLGDNEEIDLELINKKKKLLMII